MEVGRTAALYGIGVVPDKFAAFTTVIAVDAVVFVQRTFTKVVPVFARFDPPITGVTEPKSRLFNAFENAQFALTVSSAFGPLEVVMLAAADTFVSATAVAIAIVSFKSFISNYLPIG